jgi:hypothetical protein
MITNPDWAADKPEEQPKTLPVNEAYKLSRIHPDDLLVDEDAGPLNDDVSWKAQRIKRPLEDVKNDGRFRAAARKIITASEVREDYQRDREEKKKGSVFASDGKQKTPDVCVLYELYHLQRKQWLVVAEGCEQEFLIAPAKTPPGIERDPFIDLRFTLRDDSWYPVPPVSQWIDPQKAYCERRTKIAVHNKRFNRKYQLNHTGFEDPEKAAADLEHGEDGTVLVTQTPGDHVVPVKDAPLDMQVHTEVAYAKQDFTELAIGANQRGATQGIESATEAGILEVRAQVREGDWVGLVTDFLTNIGRKVDQQVQTHITKNEAIKVSGPQGEYWELVRQQDYGKIAGEFEYSINVGQRTPQLPEIERAQWTAFLTLIGNVPWLAMSDELLKEAARLHHIDNEMLVKQIQSIAQKLLSGQFQQQGQQGSMPNVSTMNPQAAMGGRAMGVANMRTA